MKRGTMKREFLLKSAIKEGEIEKLQEDLGEFDLYWKQERLYLSVSFLKQHRTPLSFRFLFEAAQSEQDT